MRTIVAPVAATAPVRASAGSPDLIEGWGLPFGGPIAGQDTYGEHFSARTNLCGDWFPADARPLLYQHGLDAETDTAVVGRVKAWETQSKGVWVQAQLDASSEYHEAIKELLGAGKLYFSSGAMGHLVRTDMKSGEILRWPWVELSLTPTPANVYATLDYAKAAPHLKAVGADLAAVKATLDAKAEDALPDSDYAYIDSQGERHLPIPDEAHVRNALSRFSETTFESEAAKAAAWKKIVAKAKEFGIEVSDADKGMGKPAARAAGKIQGSYEDLIADLRDALNTNGPYGGDVYTSIVATFPEHVLVCRYQWDDDGDDAETFWDVQYSLDAAGDPVLGDATQYEQVYQPKATKGALGPLTLDAGRLALAAKALGQRTKDLAQRRIAEGRAISGANRRVLDHAITQTDEALGNLRAALTDTDRAQQAVAKAAALREPAALRQQVELLAWFAETLPAEAE